MRFSTTYAGTTLLEVLVTLFVLSIGLCAYLQATLIALQNTQSAYLRSIAELQIVAFAEGLHLCNVERNKAHCLAQLQNRWRAQTLSLLPDAKIEINPQANHYQLTMRWHVHHKGPSNNVESVQLLVPS